MFKTNLIRKCIDMTLIEQGVDQLPSTKILQIIDYADHCAEALTKVGITIPVGQCAYDDRQKVEALVESNSCSLSNIILKRRSNEEDNSQKAL